MTSISSSSSRRFTTIASTGNEPPPPKVVRSRLRRPTISSSAPQRAPLADIRNRTGHNPSNGDKDAVAKRRELGPEKPRSKSSSRSRSRSRSTLRGAGVPKPKNVSSKGANGTRNDDDDNDDEQNGERGDSASRNTSKLRAQPLKKGLSSPAVRVAKSSRRGRDGASVNPFPIIEFDPGPLNLRDPPPPPHCGGDLEVALCPLVDRFDRTVGSETSSDIKKREDIMAASKRGMTGLGHASGTIEPVPEKRQRRLPARKVVSVEDDRGSNDISGPKEKSDIQPPMVATEVIHAQPELTKMIDRISSSAGHGDRPHFTPEKTIEEELSTSISFASLNGSAIQDKVVLYKSEAYESRIRLKSAEQTILSLRKELEELRFFRDLESEEGCGCGRRMVGKGEFAGTEVRKNQVTIEESREVEVLKLREETDRLRASNAHLESEASSLRATVALCEMAAAQREEDAARIASLERDLRAADQKSDKENRDCEEMRTERDKLAAELREAKGRMGDMAINFAEKVETVGLLERKNKAMVVEATETKERHKLEVLALRKELQDALTARGQDFASLEDDSREKAKRLHDLTSQLEIKQEELLELNGKLESERASHKMAIEETAEKHCLSSNAKDGLLKEIRMKWKEEEATLRKELSQAHTDLEAMEDLKAKLNEVQEKARLDASSAQIERDALSDVAESAKAEVRMLQSRVGELQKELQNAISCNEEDTAELERLKEQLKRSGSEIEEREAILSVTKTRLTNVESELSQRKLKYDADIRDMKMELLTAKSNLSEKENHLAAYQSKVKDLEAKLESTQSEISEMRQSSESRVLQFESRCKDINQDRCKRKARASVFESMLSQTRARTVDLESEAEADRQGCAIQWEAERRDLENAVKKIIKENESLISEAEGLRKDVDQLRETNREMEKQACKHFNETNDRVAEVTQLEEKIEALKSKVANAEEEQEQRKIDYESSVRELRKDLDKTLSERDTLKKECLSVCDEAMNIERKLSEKEKIIKGLQETLSHKETELETAKSNLDIASTKVKELNAKVEKLREDLNKQVDARESALAQIRAHLEFYQARAKDNEAGLISTKNENKELAQLIQQMEEERKDLSLEIKRITEERNSAVAESKSLEATIEMYNLSIQKTDEEMKKEIATLEHRLREAENQSAFARRQMKEDSAARAALEQELEQAEKELTAKSDEVDNLFAKLQETKDELENSKKNVNSAFAKVDDHGTASFNEQKQIFDRHLKRKDAEVRTLRVNFGEMKKQMDKVANRNRYLELDLDRAIAKCGKLEKSLRDQDPGNCRELHQKTDATGLRAAAINAKEMRTEVGYGNDHKVRKKIESDALHKYVTRRFEESEF